MFVGNPWMRFNTFFRLKSMETKVQVHVKLQGPIYNGTLETFTWTKVLPSCVRLEKCLFLCVYLLFLHCFIAQVTFVEKQKMKKKKQFKETKILMSNSCLIRQRFQGNRSKSGFAIFA